MPDGGEGKDMWNVDGTYTWGFVFGQDVSEPSEERQGRSPSQELSQSSLTSWETSDSDLKVQTDINFSVILIKKLGSMIFQSLHKNLIACYSHRIWRFAFIENDSKSSGVGGIAHTPEFWHMYTWLASIIYVTAKCQKLF